jgi:integrase/recombinase XerD
LAAARVGEDVLTPDEVARLVKACSPRAASGIRNRALVAMLYRCGMRVSEVIALDASDVDRDARSLHVASARGRWAGMDAGSFSLVERWIERRSELRLSGSGPLLCTLHGQRLSASYIRALLPRLARKAGVEKRVSSEVLRRTLAVELAREGFPVGLIQVQLGHASTETTTRYLARLAPEDIVAAMSSRASWRP